jgi:hypothetical protein
VYMRRCDDDDVYKPVWPSGLWDLSEGQGDTKVTRSVVIDLEVATSVHEDV